MTDRIEKRKHTPLPWISEKGDRYVRAEDTGGTICRVCEDDGHCDPEYAEAMPMDDNAEFIDLACNNHYRLRGALQMCESILAEHEQYDSGDGLSGETEAARCILPSIACLQYARAVLADTE